MRVAHELGHCRRIEQIRRVPCVNLDVVRRCPGDSVYLVPSKPECGYRGTADESRRSRDEYATHRVKATRGLGSGAAKPGGDHSDHESPQFRELGARHDPREPHTRYEDGECEELDGDCDAERTERKDPSNAEHGSKRQRRQDLLGFVRSRVHGLRHPLVRRGEEPVAVGCCEGGADDPKRRNQGEVEADVHGRGHHSQKSEPARLACY